MEMDQETLPSCECIKASLISTESLSHYDPQLPASLACDASSVGVGAVIFHTLPNGTEKVAAYASRKLSVCVCVCVYVCVCTFICFYVHMCHIIVPSLFTGTQYYTPRD